MKTNDIFDIRRFGSYLLSDGRANFSNYGTELLTISLSGLSIYLLICFFHMFGMMEYYDYSTGVSSTVFAIAMMIVCITVGSKCYGRITEKRYGTQFLMLPVSAFEKTLSIVIYSVLIPLTFMGVFLGVDYLISLVDSQYNMPLVKLVWSTTVALNEAFQLSLPENEMAFLLNPLLQVDDMMNGILVFVLGAVVFRKNKVAKTILSLFGLGIVFSILVTPFMSGFVEKFVNAPFVSPFYEHIALWDTVADLSILAVLVLAIYFRIRTIKH